MAVSQDPDRVAVVCDQTRCTTAELSALADGGAGLIAASGAQSVAYVGMGGDMLPLLLFAAARAGVPCAPLNYRLDRKSTRLNSSHVAISYAVFCLKKKQKK